MGAKVRSESGDLQIAGQAKTKLTNPNPNEARRAVMLFAPDCSKMVEE